MITSRASVTSYDELPRRKFMAIDLYQWQGFWYFLPHLKAVLLAQTSFKARNDDILLASSMKTGITWLKALILSIRIIIIPIMMMMMMMMIMTHSSRTTPMSVIPSLEVQIFYEQNVSNKYNISGARSPRDEELVRYYLRHKACGKPFRFQAISEIDVYKFEPWDLQGYSSLKTRDLEWYFFSPVDRKYCNGSRLNHATGRGYWKATGKDRAVRHKAQTIGCVDGYLNCVEYKRTP